MNDRPSTHQGLKRLVKQCQDAFQGQENTDYYSDEDYQSARRKFVKFCLLNETGKEP